jgi:CSLREA domain-containing protein
MARTQTLGALGALTAVLAFSGAFAPTGVAHAATIAVTTTSDESTDNGFCSLREALESANRNSNAHEDACTQGEPRTSDVVSIPAGTYMLSGAAAEDDNDSGDLDIKNYDALPPSPLYTNEGADVTLEGAGDSGAGATIIDANDADRAIDVQSDGSMTSIDITLRDLAIQNGTASGTGEDGGGVDFSDSDGSLTLDGVTIKDSFADRWGGAVNFANSTSGQGYTLVITDSEIDNNSSGGRGGGVYTRNAGQSNDEVGDGTAVRSLVSGSTFVNNDAGASGGAIYVAGSPDGTTTGSLGVINSTVTGNTAASGGGGLGMGASGVFTYVWFSTVADNISADSDGAGLHANASSQTLYLKGSIVSGNTANGNAANCMRSAAAGGGTGWITSQSYSLESANTCGLAGTGDLINTDPSLTALGDNGGPTRTRGLRTDSAALDRIPRSGTDYCAESGDVDQRAVARPASPGLCDVGAFEGTTNSASPVIGAAGVFPIVYTEGAAAVVIDGDITVSDTDDTNLESATVTISSALQSSDELGFTNQNGISGSYDSGTGVLTLTGSSSVANYQTALRSVTYRNTGDNPFGIKAIQFQASDGDTNSNVGTTNLLPMGLNDAPQIATTGSALSYTEVDGAVAVDSGLTVTDPDSVQISTATVRITGNHSQAEDDLEFTNQNGISGSYDDASGTLTLTGATSLANYQTALRSVKYINSSSSPSTATRTVTFRVTDDLTAQSSPATRDITLADAPDDDDGDGVPDVSDNCPAAANAGQANNDGDAQGDACDSDDDNDTVADGSDNCPIVANADQANSYGDSRGDACEAKPSDPEPETPAPDTPAPEAPASNTAAPVLSDLSVGHRKFAALEKGVSIAATRFGTRVAYTLSEPASVKFKLLRRENGRWVKLRGSFTHEGETGRNRFRFTGRLRGRTLRSGRYLLRATPTDSARNKGRAAKASFRILPPS